MPIFRPAVTLNCAGRPVHLDRPFIMGILNVTPDSFYDGGKHRNIEDAVRHAGNMLREGADILDVGGMSTRPGASAVPPAEEIERVIPVIERLAASQPGCLISIDTVHAEVARLAVQAGAAMINDVSCGTHDPAMIETAATLNVPYVAMHMQGRPENMQDDPRYEDVIISILDYFIARTRELEEAGIPDIIIDPGLGFGKTLMHNYEILARLEVLHMLERPILVGASRKSMIYNLLDTTAEGALNGSTAVHMFALTKGASILRVHDVSEARQCIKIYEALEHGRRKPERSLPVLLRLKSIHR